MIEVNLPPATLPFVIPFLKPGLTTVERLRMLTGNGGEAEPFGDEIEALLIEIVRNEGPLQLHDWTKACAIDAGRQLGLGERFIDEVNRVANDKNSPALLLETANRFLAEENTISPVKDLK